MCRWQLQYHAGRRANSNAHARFITHPDAYARPRPNGNPNAYPGAIAYSDTLANTRSWSITHPGTVSRLVTHDQFPAGPDGPGASASARV
jgi:hypothetical protein